MHLDRAAPFVRIACRILDLLTKEAPLLDRLCAYRSLEHMLPGEASQAGGDWRRDVPALVRAIADEDFNVRMEAAEVLGELPPDLLASPAVIEALLMGAGDDDFRVREQAAEGLSSVPEQALEQHGCMERLVAALEKGAGQDRAAAALTMASLPAGLVEKHGLMAHLLAATEADDPRLRAAAVGATKSFPAAVRGARGCLQALFARTLDDAPEVRVAALSTLALLLPRSRRARLAQRALAMTGDPSPEVRAAALDALGSLPDDLRKVHGVEIERRVFEAMGDAHWSVRAKASQIVSVLPSIAPLKANLVDRVLSLAADQDCDVRKAGIIAFGLPDSILFEREAQIIRILLEALREQDHDVRTAAAMALEMHLPDRVFRQREVLDALIVALGDREWKVHKAAALALTRVPVHLLREHGLSQEHCDAITREHWLVHDHAPETRSIPTPEMEDLVPDLLAGLCDRYWYVRIQAANGLGRLPAEILARRHTLEHLLAALGDESKRVRHKMMEVLSEMAPSERVETTWTSYREQICPRLSAMLAGFEEEVVDAPRFLCHLQGSLLWLWHRTGVHACDLVQQLLEGKGAVGLFRFLRIVTHLSTGREIARLASLRLSEQEISPVPGAPLGAVIEAGACWWQGRSLLTPLGGDRVLVLKLLREGQPENELAHEAAVMQALPSLGIKEGPIPFSSTGGFLFALPEGIEAPMGTAPCRRGIVSVTSWDRVDYPVEGAGWLPYAVRTEMARTLARGWGSELSTLHGNRFAYRTLLSMSHDTTNLQPWDITAEPLGDICPFYQGMRYPNFRIGGLADFEEVLHEPPDLPTQAAQNLLEALLYTAYWGVSIELQGGDIVDTLQLLLDEYLRQEPAESASEGLEELVDAVQYGVIVNRCSFGALRRIRRLAFQYSGAVTT